MTINKINLDTKRMMITILVDQTKVVTISNGNSFYDLLLNRFVTCNTKKFSDVINDQIIQFIQQQGL